MKKEIEIIGKSEAIQKILNLIDKISKSDSTVLITGESGTGKELVARLIHEQSARAIKPFIPVNCAAIPSELLESELFGYEKGAFTGAINSRPGRFELADEGTIFLDEVGDMPINLQVKILRVIQERSFEKIGSTKPINVNVRIIAATNKNLENEVKEGKFREDLFWRLNVVPLIIPPLRERKEDIPILCDYFINRFSTKFGYKLNLNKEVLDLFKKYDWPGNVRELENLIERLYVFSDNGVVKFEDIPERIKFKENSIPPDLIYDEFNPFATEIDLNELIMEYERKLILHSLNMNKWIISKSAKYLKINRTTLIEKMKRLGIKNVKK